MAHAEPEIALGDNDWRPVKILEVVDTRTYEEGPDDRWHPIPGSGTVNQCDRCGKDHEVHVLVEDQAGRPHVIGTSCAHAEGPLAKRLASVASATQRLAALEAQFAVAEAYLAKRSAVEAELRPQFPGWDEAPGPADPRALVWTTKDGLASVWVRAYPDGAKPDWEMQSDWERRRKDTYDERERCLRDLWLRERIVKEAGPPPKVPDLATLRSDIAKTRARLASLRDKAGKEHLPLEQAAAKVVTRSGVDPKDKKAVYTEDDLRPYVGKTVTVLPKPGKLISSTRAYYRAPVTGTLHSIWKDRNGNVRGFRLARTREVPMGGDALGFTEIEEFGSKGHGSLEVVEAQTDAP
jgi:hypothetical protein